MIKQGGDHKKTFFKFLAWVSKTIAAVAVATAFRVLYWWRQYCKQISNGRLEIFKKIVTLLTVTVLFLFTFFNLILDATRTWRSLPKKIILSVLKNLGLDPDWIRIQQQPDPDVDSAKIKDSDPDSLNPDPKHCTQPPQLKEMMHLCVVLVWILYCVSPMGLQSVMR